MDDVDKIKSKVDIVELLGEHLPLKKAGRNFKTTCPFHSEKTPSFVVSAECQIWHCFGCNKGGDIFTLFMEYENITFGEALRELAERTGVKLTVSAARSDREKKQELIYSLNHLSAQFYNYLLLSHPAGKRGLKYLSDERKLTIPLIKTFNLGYAPANDTLVKYLIGKKKYKEDDLLLAGLAYRKGRYVSDFFKDRIIFPIINHRKDVVAFSGRSLPERNRSVEGPKYVNTRETPVYVKGDTLFGLNLATDAIKKEGKVIIVEGEFDVISAHKEGILNIVAVKGTALTDNQIKLLKRFTQKFTFCFDQDPAGTEAQRKSIALIEKEGITATVISLALGKDADDVLRQNPAVFKKAVRNDTNVYDFIIDSAINQFDQKTSEGKKNILKKTLPYIGIIENEVIREHFLKKLAERIDTSFDSVLKQADKEGGAEVEKPKISQKALLPYEEVLEIYLLSLIFQSKNPKQSLTRVLAILDKIKLTTPSLDKLLSYLEKYNHQNSVFDTSNFVKFIPAELHVPFDTSFLAPIPEFADDEHFFRELEKVVKQVKKLSIKKKLAQLTGLINEAEAKDDDEKLKNYKEQFNSYTKLLS